MSNVAHEKTTRTKYSITRNMTRKFYCSLNNILLPMKSCGEGRISSPLNKDQELGRGMYERCIKQERQAVFYMLRPVWKSKYISLRTKLAPFHPQDILAE